MDIDWIHCVGNSYFIRIYTFFPVRVNTSFADRITLDVEDYGGREGFTTQINQDDVETFKKVFSGWERIDNPICPCIGVRVNFSSGDKTLSLFPAGDSCGIILFVRKEKEYYLRLNDESNEMMREILKRYGVVWPYGI